MKADKWLACPMPLAYEWIKQDHPEEVLFEERIFTEDLTEKEYSILSSRSAQSE